MVAANYMNKIADDITRILEIYRFNILCVLAFFGK